MPNTLHERLITALEALMCRAQLLYLITSLKKTYQVNNHAQAAIFIFCTSLDHPEIMQDPMRKELFRLCQECFLQATPNQLYSLLSQPKNKAIKERFDLFVKTVTHAEKQEEARPSFKGRQ